jgi:PAS domain S-box-containing protein
MPSPEPLSPAEMQPPPSAVDILLVDDQHANLLALRNILEGLGQNLVEAHSGEEALRRLLERDFAVILLDVQMQGMDGYETAHLIRSRDRSHHTPIIFLTAYEDNRFPVEHAYTLGAVDYLVKPLVPKILLCKVGIFVELFQKTQEVQRLQRQEFDRQLAEENARFRDSEQRFARFMHHFPGLAWIKDVQGRYVYANDAAWKAFCVPQAELYGKTDEEVFPPAIAAQFREHDRKAMASDVGVQVIESLPHEDGIVHHSVVSKFAIPGPNGEPALVGGMAIDITDRLRVEEALKEADRRKDEFLAMLAHELRNPLAPIRNALHILKMRNADGVSLGQARDMMERQLQHLVRLVDDLLDVSRIMRNKITLRKERVPLRQLVERAVETAQPVIDAQGHILKVALPDDPIWMEADSVRLAQVIANLLNNAAKYTQRAGHIRLIAVREGDEIILKVEDNGIGIAPDLLPKVFDLFMQADRSLDRSQGGLGIGLTLVKRLVEMHGGHVEARSGGPGKGSEFIVRLPLASESTRIEEASPSTGIPPQPRRRILVVDDNVDAAESVAMIFRLLRQNVRVAHDGASALVLAEEFNPELIVLDIGLPGMDGYEVARRLRNENQSQPPFLVAMTGYGQDDDRQRSRSAGFDVHLVKPVDPEELRRLLSEPGFRQRDGE